MSQTFEEWWNTYLYLGDDLDKELAKAAWEEAVVNSKLIPKGYVLVPIEPTEKMIEAGDALWDHHCTSIYEAMIQAAQENTNEC